MSHEKRNLDYSSKDLTGMQIMHDSMSFQVGEEVVLTLADTDVIKRDQYGRIVSINDSDDALENVNFAEYERKEDRDRRLKRLHQPVYSGYDDEEFEDNGIPGKKRGILSQYDQEKKRGAKMIIGDGKVMNLSNSANISKNTFLQEKKAAYQSLHTEYKTGSDFIDPSEIKFKKVKKSDKHKRQREKSPERIQDVKKRNPSDNSTEDEYDMSKILGGDEIEVAMKDTKNETISQPSTAHEEDEKRLILSSLISKKRRLNLFSVQLAKASVQSVVYDDEDPDFSLAMARARQSAIAARRKDPSAMEEDEDDNLKIQISSQQKSGEEEDYGAKIAREMALRALKITADKDLGSAETKDDDGNNNEQEMDVEGRKSDGKLVFNSTTEFASRLQARLTDRARQASELAMREMERHMAPADGAAAVERRQEISVTEDKLLIDKNDNGNEQEKESCDKVDRDNGETLDDEFIMDIEEDDDSNSDEENEVDPDEDEQLAFLHKQPLFSKGLGATLALLKDSGELNKPKLLAGRARDFRDKDDYQNDSSNIRLEYRDEHGNLLTKKEEFRRLSYHFHGQGPGKKKLEKRLKAQKALTRAGLPKAGVLDGTAGTMKSLNRALEATGRSHVMLQGGVTADPETITALAQEMMKKKEKKEKKKEKDSIVAGGTKK